MDNKKINIHCLHYLLPNNEILNNKQFEKFMSNLKYDYIILPSNHICIHILDSIHYKLLAGTVDFDLYEMYINKTKQYEHSVKKYKHLIESFDICKMPPINVYIKKINGVDYSIIQDGCHRLSLLLYKNYGMEDIKKNIRFIF